MSVESEQRIIVVGGTLVSGKGMYCKHLAEEHDYKHISYGDVLREEADRQGRDRERTTLLDISSNIRLTKGLTGLAELALDQWGKEAHLYPGGLVVDGPRAIGDADGLQRVGGRLLFVDAPIELRYQWMLDRDRDAEAGLSFEEFVANNQREWEGDGTLSGPNISAIKAMAEVVIENTGTQADMVNRLDEVLELSH